MKGNDLGEYTCGGTLHATQPIYLGVACTRPLLSAKWTLPSRTGALDRAGPEPGSSCMQRPAASHSSRWRGQLSTAPCGTQEDNTSVASVLFTLTNPRQQEDKGSVVRKLLVKVLCV